jgi:type IV pilus assembly protein PilW
MTFLEVVIAIGILAIVVAIAMHFLKDRYRSNEMQILATQMRQDARLAMDLVVRELRMAGYDTTGAGFAGLPYSSSQLTIQADLDGDGAAAGENEVIVYAFDAGAHRITRTTGGATATVIDNVESFSFTYKDEDGNPVTSAAQQSAIRRVDIAMTVRTARPDPGYHANGGYRTISMESTVIPPNLAF